VKTLQTVLQQLNAQDKAWLRIWSKKFHRTADFIRRRLREKTGEDVSPSSIRDYLRGKQAASARLGHFVGYHNTEKWGTWQTARKGQLDSFFTAKHYHPETLVGNWFWAIQAIGSPRRFRLVNFGRIERITKRKRPAPHKGLGNVIWFRTRQILNKSFDVTDLPWFRELHKEQQSFRHGLSRIRSKRVITVLERFLKGRFVNRSLGVATQRRSKRTRKPSLFEDYRKTVHYVLKSEKRELNPKHHNFQVRLNRYLEQKGIHPEFERNFVDVTFRLRRTIYIGEIKVAEIQEVNQAFRIALGQLLEYGHLLFTSPPRLLMFLDKRPDANRVRLATKLSICVICETETGFRVLNPTVSPVLKKFFRSN
jgi:hypothetical protein